MIFAFLGWLSLLVRTFQLETNFAGTTIIKWIRCKGKKFIANVEKIIVVDVYSNKKMLNKGEINMKDKLYILSKPVKLHDDKTESVII